MLIAVLLVSVPLAVANNWLRSIREQRAVVRQLAPFRPRTVFSAGELKLLHIEDSSLADRHLKPLSELHELEWLTLQSVQVTDKSLRKLRWLTKLRFLALDSTSITDDGLRNLSDLNELR